MGEVSGRLSGRFFGQPSKSIVFNKKTSFPDNLRPASEQAKGTMRCQQLPPRGPRAPVMPAGAAPALVAVARHEQMWDLPRIAATMPARYMPQAAGTQGQNT